MSKIYTFLCLLCLLGLNLFSQRTNTKKWRKSENDSMQSALMMFDDANYLLALPIYEKLYTAHPKEDFLKYCYGKCALFRSDKHDIALTLLSEVYDKNKRIENIEFDLSKAYHLNYKFDEAIALLDKSLSKRKILPEAKQNAEQLKQYCINGKELYSHPTGAKISNIGNKINSVNDEYVPIVSADESVMIYTYRGPESKGGRQNEFKEPDKHGTYYEDVFQSVQVDGQWTKPVPVDNANTTAHDGAIALSVDGSYLFVYRDLGDDHGDIYMSTSLYGEWSYPQKLNGQVNSYSWEGSCSLTADGRQLYFSSERGGGFGGKDIYRATLMPDSTWGNVINLGDSINTAYDDDAPFIHPDGVTLFYSSKGKNSMGGYDIFQSKFNWKDSTFGRPVNLGYPINTTDDDIYYILSANGERGYYASGKPGGEGLKDIYTVYPGYVGKKPSLYVVKGKITSDGNPVSANILVEITDRNNKKFGEFISNSANGNYLVSLPADAMFKLTYRYKSFPSKTLDINTTAIDGFQQKIFDVNFNLADTSKAVAVAPVPIKDTTVVVAHVAVSQNLAKPSKIIKEPVVKEPKPAAVKESKQPVTNDPKEPVKQTDNFVPNNPLQQKTKDYSALYGDVSVEGLIFKVQIAAYKNPKSYDYSHLKGLGTVEKLLLDDGITRITIGGEFNTLAKAFEHNKKVVARGQKDAFVTILYNGKRIFLEDLEKMGIYIKK